MARRSRSFHLLPLAAGALLAAAPAFPATPRVSGELKQWHKVTLTLDGPSARERDVAPNPFLDYRLTVAFAHESGTPRYEVPGYFAADGHAADTSAEAGNQWRAHLSPDQPGRWTYRVSFVRGPRVAVDPAEAGEPIAGLDGLAGEFTVGPTDKTGRDFRGQGRLEYVGRHHLRFAGSGAFFLKAGADAPETLLAYADFDGTAARKKDVPLKSWSPHVRDWRPGDPSWQGGKGKGLIGALDYLAGRGANAFSFLTYNAGGDGDDVWPFVERDDKLHYDCSKLDQWQLVFDHAQALGLFLHFKTQETENDDERLGDARTPGRVPEALDGGRVGVERRLYYRELVARFAHELALNWNLGEENTQTPEEQRAMAEAFDALDPYHHPVVLHTHPGQQERVYRPLLGGRSRLAGVSLQNGWDEAHRRVLQWRRESEAAGRPWVVANDEQNPWDLGVPPDAGYAGFDGRARPANAASYTADDVRRRTLWGTLMAGGAGVEYYFGYRLPQNDLLCEDWRSRERSWDQAAIAVEFFRDHAIPFAEMEPADALAGNAAEDDSRYALAKPGDTYLVYLPHGGEAELDLSRAAGTFQLEWFSPTRGGPLRSGSVRELRGGGRVSLGLPPAEGPDPGEDWLALVRRAAAAPSAAVEPGSAWPKVTLVDLAAPDVLHVVVQTGEVMRGRQRPYVAEPGDTIQRSTGGAIVVRGGRELGGLADHDRLLFPFERVVQAPFTPERWRQATRVRLRCPDDPDYREGRPPDVVDLKTRPYEVSRVGGWTFEAPLEHHFYFRFARALRPGHAYQLSIAGETLAIPRFALAPRRTRSEAVHVGQVGFRPDDPSKLAFVSTWTGSGGGLRYPDAMAFEVIDDATGEPAFQGRTRLSRRAEQNDDRAAHSHTHADVHECDFSGLARPGRYRVSVEGLGTSFPFTIAADAWQRAFVTSARGFYHQRRSIELGPPYTDYVRPRGLDPRFGTTVLQSRTGLMDTGNGLNRKAKNNFDELVAGATERPAGPGAWGGLMDAGDWDSRAQHLVVTRYLLELVELRPEFFRQLGLHLPESTNALPDVVDEALFNLDHYRRLQLPDGGVRGGVESEEHPRYGEASWQESQRSLAYAPDVWSSHLYAGAAARAAFVLETLGARAQARGYLESALRAMRWAEARPLEERTRYPQLRDTRALAAAELFRATGGRAWQRVFAEASDFGQPTDGAHGSPVAIARGGEQADAAFVHARTERPGIDLRLREACRRALLAAGDRLVESSERTAFRWARVDGDATGWAGFGIVDAVALARAHALTGDARYLKSLVDAAQLTAGANPLNTSFTTGVGARWPRRPLHVDSNVTGQAAPAGITVAGPIDQGMDWDETFAKIVRPYLRPEAAQWPKLECYWEMFWYPPITEYTVQWPMAQNAYVWGYLAARR